MSDFILFLPKNSDKVEKISAINYKEEKTLQDLIEKHPEILPLSSGVIITLAREYPITGGSIDLLCVDEEAKIYIIETKMQKNSDRRQAVAQLIDYGAQLGKESFENFQAKIHEKTQKTLEELLKEFGDEQYPSVDAIRKSLQEKNFILVLVMDRFEPALKDMINYLRLDNEMNVFGVELQAYPVAGQGQVFVPEIIPPPEIQSLKRSPSLPVTKEEVVRNYAKEGLETEINHILRVFEDAMQKWPGVAQVRSTPVYMVLDIGNRQIQVTLNKDARWDHGVWVSNPLLYEKILELGKRLEMNVKMSEKTSAKIIIFNGPEGIKKLSNVIEELVSGLINILQKS